jgi:hypothetical protein
MTAGTITCIMGAFRSVHSAPLPILGQLSAAGGHHHHLDASSADGEKLTGCRIGDLRTRRAGSNLSAPSGGDIPQAARRRLLRHREPIRPGYVLAAGMILGLILGLLIGFGGLDRLGIKTNGVNSGGTQGVLR